MDNVYELTEKGAEVLVSILSEFFHGFTFDEIVANNPDVNSTMIPMLFYALFAQAGLATPITVDDDDTD